MMKSYTSHRKTHRPMNDADQTGSVEQCSKFDRANRRESMLNALRLMGSQGGNDNKMRSSLHNLAGSRRGSLLSKNSGTRKGSLGFHNIMEESESDGVFESESQWNKLKSHQGSKFTDNASSRPNQNISKRRAFTMPSTGEDSVSASDNINNRESYKDIKRRDSVLLTIDDALGVQSVPNTQSSNSINVRRSSLMNKLRGTLQAQVEDKPKSRNGAKRGSSMSRMQDTVLETRGGMQGLKRTSSKSNGSSTFLSTGQLGSQNSHRLHVQLQKTRTRNKEKRLRKFRSSAKIIIFFYRLCKTHYLSANDKGTATRGAVDDDDQKELLFDVTYFKANRKSGISSDAKRILTMNSHERTDKEKYHCLISLRNYKTFAEYPLAMQQAVVQCAWYENYSAKRVILRQGHQPHNFYFILSGSVLVNVLEPGSQFAKTVVYLHKGETFGELAIVNKAQRQSTIIAREGIELLCIDADNYVQIFMAGGITTLFDRENEFVKNLKFLEGWPLHLLVGNRKKCVFSYFKRGDVLIKNSKTTDWILIVKSGSCSVMKRLKQMESSLNQRRRFSLSDANGFPDHMKYRKRMSLLPGLDKVGGRSFENFDQRKRREEFEMFLKDLDTTKLFGTRGGYTDEPGRTGIISNENKRVSFQEGEAEKEGGTETISQRNLQERRRSSETKHILASTGLTIRRSTLPAQTNKPHLVRRQRAKSIASNQNTIDEDTEDGIGYDEQSEDSGEDDPLKRFYKITGDIQVASDANRGAPVGKRKTIVDEVIDTNLDDQEQGETKPIWANVQTLTKGSVFGLAELAFGLQPSFAVVSNGAECILLSKKFYLEHVDSHMMTRLRTDEYPYPTDEEMQAQLEVEMKWETFRIGTLKQTVIRKSKEKIARKSSVSEVDFS